MLDRRVSLHRGKVCLPRSVVAERWPFLLAERMYQMQLSAGGYVMKCGDRETVPRYWQTCLPAPGEGESLAHDLHLFFLLPFCNPAFSSHDSYTTSRRQSSPPPPNCFLILRATKLLFQLLYSFEVEDGILLISLRMGFGWVMAWVVVGKTVTCQLIQREVGMILKSGTWPYYAQSSRATYEIVSPKSTRASCVVLVKIS